MLAWPENSFRATRQIGHLKTFLNVTSLDTQDVKQLTKRRLKVQKRWKIHPMWSWDMAPSFSSMRYFPLAIAARWEGLEQNVKIRMYRVFAHVGLFQNWDVDQKRWRVSRPVLNQAQINNWIFTLYIWLSLSSIFVFDVVTEAVQRYRHWGNFPPGCSLPSEYCPHPALIGIGIAAFLHFTLLFIYYIS